MTMTVLAVVSFVMAVIYVILAYLIGVKKFYFLISNFRWYSEERRKNINIPAMCESIGLGFGLSALIFLISGVLTLVGIVGAFEVSLFLMLFIILITAFRSQRFDPANFDSNGKYTKKFRIIRFISVLFSFLLIIFIGYLYVATTAEPTINITADTLEIKGFYGTSRSLTDDLEVTLLDDTLHLKRTNGSAAWGYLRGNFRSAEMGSVRVFVNVDSIPWIIITQDGFNPIIISLSNSDDTLELYERLVEWVGSN